MQNVATHWMNTAVSQPKNSNQNLRIRHLMKYLASILLLAAMLAASVQADVRNRSGIRVILKMNSQAETAGTAANAAGIPQSRILGTIPKDNLVIAKLTWRQIYSAMSNPNVRQAYYDWPMSLGKTLKTRQVGGKDAGSWGLDRLINASELDGRYNMTTTGEGVNAYIIDTGLRTSHSEFEGRASHAFSAYGDGSDGNGHGTRGRHHRGKELWSCPRSQATRRKSTQ